jgi:xylulose-5-phosphate/fructose-6-phosphate phosphoketolase
MTWDFASDPDPDIVLAGIGDYPTKEVMAAIDLAKQEWPSLRIRCLNVTVLSSCGLGRNGTCLTHADFEEYFTADKPVICNFHGYPETIKAIIFDYSYHPDRFTIRGYVESGSTTTPFDMHVRNQTSRYHLVIEIFNRMKQVRRVPEEDAERIMTKYEDKIIANTDYIKIHGLDMPEIDAWQWPHSS